MTFAKTTERMERLTCVAQVPVVPTAVQKTGKEGTETARPVTRRGGLRPVGKRVLSRAIFEKPPEACLPSLHLLCLVVQTAVYSACSHAGMFDVVRRVF